jgi:hypothetical protein
VQPPELSACGLDEKDILELLQLKRFQGELMDQLLAMFPPEEAADLLRAMADGCEDRK